MMPILLWDCLLWRFPTVHPFLKGHIGLNLLGFFALLLFLQTLHGGADVSCACPGHLTPFDFLGRWLALPVDTLGLNKQHHGAVGLGIHTTAKLGQGVRFSF